MTKWISRLIAPTLIAPLLLSAQTPEPGKQTLAIPMRDGVELAADLFLPAGYSKDKSRQGLPVILITTPYDRTREGPARFWRECFLRNG